MQMYTHANGFYLVGKVHQLREELARLAFRYRNVQNLVVANRH